MKQRTRWKPGGRPRHTPRIPRQSKPLKQKGVTDSGRRKEGAAA